jgi:hypothetical protein
VDDIGRDGFRILSNYENSGMVRGAINKNKINKKKVLYSCL